MDGHTLEHKAHALLRRAEQEGWLEELVSLLRDKRPRLFEASQIQWQLEASTTSVEVSAETAEKVLLQEQEGQVQMPEGKPHEIMPLVPETVLIPAGDFWMGSAGDDPEAQSNEKPRHKVYLPDYKIGKYPVTNAQYREFVRDAKYPPPAHWDNGQIPPGKENHPVVHVRFVDTQAYCLWLSRKMDHTCRLPSEQEWEKAARGNLPDDRRYPWGSGWYENFCNTCEYGYRDTTPVIAFETINKSPFGIVDMVGNVWEWTYSVYAPYQGAVSSSTSFAGLRYTVRGGTCILERGSARISCRGRYVPNKCEAYLGFRVMMDIS